jgi:hypothetical protein
MPSGTISGKVVDAASRDPIPHAVIVWSSLQSLPPPLLAPTMWVATDAQGEFTIGNLPLAMRFKLVVTACGYKNQTITSHTPSLWLPPSSRVEIDMERLRPLEFGVRGVDPPPGSRGVPFRPSLRVSFTTRLHGRLPPGSGISHPSFHLDYSWVHEFLSIKTADNREIGGSTHSDNGVDVLFQPHSALDFDRVQLAIVNGALTDEFGQQLGSDFIWDFTTESRLPAPDVVAITPQDGATDVTAVSKIEITFNLEISAATIDFAHIQLKIGSSNPVDGRFASSGRVVTFTPRYPLQFDTNYTVTISGVQNQQETPMTTARTYHFKTCKMPGMAIDDYVPPVLSSRGSCDGLFWRRGHFLAWKYHGFEVSYPNQVPIPPEGMEFAYRAADAKGLAKEYHSSKNELYLGLALATITSGFVNLKRVMDSVLARCTPYLVLSISGTELEHDERGVDWFFDTVNLLEMRHYKYGSLFLKLITDPSLPEIEEQFLQITLPELRVETFYGSLKGLGDDWSRISAGRIENSLIFRGGSSFWSGALYDAFMKDVAGLRLVLQMECRPQQLIKVGTITVGNETNVDGAIFQPGVGFLIATFP